MRKSCRDSSEVEVEQKMLEEVCWENIKELHL